jgi:hypothetical protein
MYKELVLISDTRLAIVNSLNPLSCMVSAAAYLTPEYMTILCPPGYNGHPIIEPFQDDMMEEGKR